MDLLLPNLLNSVLSSEYVTVTCPCFYLKPRFTLGLGYPVSPFLFENFVVLETNHQFSLQVTCALALLLVCRLKP